MNDHKWLMPASAGLLIRDPRDKSIMPAEGMLKPWSGKQGTYWRRRVACGDCHIREDV